jgi:hypothetical protein
MDLHAFKQFLEWARTHLVTAFVVIMLSFLSSAGYAFLAGYAGRFGETIASEYGSFQLSVETYPVIQNILNRYLVELKAARVGVSRFHDNVRDIADNRVFFVSIESISTAPGVAAATSDLANVPADVYSEILPTLMDDKPIYVRTRDVQNSVLRELAMKRGVVAVIYVPINDLTDHLIGFLAVDWMNDADLPTSAELPTIERDLQTSAERIGAYFSHN